MTADNSQTRESLPVGQRPGALLRSARELSGRSHAVVSEALHLTVHYLKALENDDYEKLPGLIFVKGYIRSYARYLKLDVEAVVDCYESYVKELPPVKSHTLAGNYTRKRSDGAVGGALAAALIVVLGLAAGWWFVGREETAQSPQPSAASIANQAAAGATTALPTADVVRSAATILQADTAAGLGPVIVATLPPAALSEGPAADMAGGADVGAPTPAAPLSAAASPSIAVREGGGRLLSYVREGTDRLQMTFTGESWVELDDARSGRVHAETLRAGDSLDLQGTAPFQILLGNGNNVQVLLNGAVIDISGSVRSDSTARLTLPTPVPPAVPVGVAAGDAAAASNPPQGAAPVTATAPDPAQNLPASNTLAPNAPAQNLPAPNAPAPNTPAQSPPAQSTPPQNTAVQSNLPEPNAAPVTATAADPAPTATGAENSSTPTPSDSPATPVAEESL
jgi:cytoskeleton protein RodZ